jgi:hypothetical protein
MTDTKSPNETRVVLPVETSRRWLAGASSRPSVSECRAIVEVAE